MSCNNVSVPQGNIVGCCYGINFAVCRCLLGDGAEDINLDDTTSHMPSRCNVNMHSKGSINLGVSMKMNCLFPARTSLGFFMRR